MARMGNYNYPADELDILMSRIATHRGAHNPITSVELAGPEGDPIAIRKMVKALRYRGEIICSGQAGYYIPKTSTEVKDTMDYIEAQAKELEHTLKTMRAHYERILVEEDKNGVRTQEGNSEKTAGSLF